MLKPVMKMVAEQDTLNQKIAAKKRPLILIWIGLVLIAVMGLFAFYQLQSKSADEKTHALLQSVAESKVAYLDGWLTERYSDLATFSESDAFIELFPRLTTHPDDLRRVENRIAKFNAIYGYEKFTLVDAQDQVITSVGDVKVNMAEHTNALLKKAKQQLSTQTQLFIQDNLFHLDFVAPLINRHGAEPVYLGSIILHLNPARFVVPMLNRWPISTETGKTELIFANLSGQNQQTMKLVPLEHEGYRLGVLSSEQANQITQLNHTERHSTQATLFKVATASGQTVFQYHTHLKMADWVVIASMSESEAYSNLRHNLMVLALSLVTALSLIGLLFARTFKNEQARLKSELLEQSQTYFMGLFMDAPIAYQSLNEQCEILNVNRAWCDLFGYSRQDVIGQSYEHFLAADSLPVLNENFSKLLEEGHIDGVECQIKTRSGEMRLVRIDGRTSVDAHTDQTHTHCVLVDISKEKQHAHTQERTLAVTKALFNLSMDAPALDEKGLLEMGMNALENFTQSQIGFVHFVSEDQNQIQLATWSTRTLKHYCTASFDNHYPVDEAGIWADSVRTKQAKVVNDYDLEPNKKGLPEGHSVLSRFVSVPIISDGLVRMIVGVGNAEQAYDDFDVQSITQFGNELYQLVLIKRTQLKLEESEKRFHSLFEKAPMAYQSLSEEGKILEVNEAWLTLFGLHRADYPMIIGKPITDFVSPESVSQLTEVFPQFLENGSWMAFCLRWWLKMVN
ncbi:MAG: PAS domain S-box protein [Thiotrichales bacterium]|nr:PAS domain S-box protein [Thiotrichales bacterium]